jgi:hypothetical protein
MVMDKRIQHELNYIAFLEKRLASSNYKKNVSKEEYEETEAKLKKAKFILKVLKTN